MATRLRDTLEDLAANRIVFLPLCFLVSADFYLNDRDEVVYRASATRPNACVLGTEQELVASGASTAGWLRSSAWAFGVAGFALTAASVYKAVSK